MIISIIIFRLISSIAGSLAEPGINFNPRLLQKELSSIFRDDAYDLIELPVGRSISGDNDSGGKFFRVVSSEGPNIMVYVGRVNACRAVGCSNPENSGIDLQYEFFDYFIIFDALKVKVVRVFNYEATHGQEVIIKKWLDQFAGYDGDNPLRVGKEIDSISGATISVNAIVADVKEKTLILNNYD